MAALHKPAPQGFLARLFKFKRQHFADSRRARDFANHVYKKTGGPTPEAKRLYAALLDNEQRAAR